jgi:hypothetical protein
MDSKPEGWTGTCEDQMELFVEILAYLVEREIRDTNHGCYSADYFNRVVPGMLEDGFYREARAEFKQFLKDWGVEYLPESGVYNEALCQDGQLPEKLYCAQLLARCPNGKAKKYADVYEELE